MRAQITLRLLGCALAGGCGFQTLAPPADAGPGLPDACMTFSSQLDTCPLGMSDDVELTGTQVSYDTGTHQLQGSTASVATMVLATRAGKVDAIVAHNVLISPGTVLRATGPLPFAIIASGAITLAAGAAVDVGVGGAGAATGCSNPAGPGSPDDTGAGGGGGGGLAPAGGHGGPGDKQQASPTLGGSPSNSIAMPDGPQGGCPGGTGGAGGSAGGAGGPAGGALYFVAADHIQLGTGAMLYAGGGGGAGGTGGNELDGDAGGGGGGSGGMIWLEAPHVVGPASSITANGGGGGEGSSSSTPGNAGQPGLLTKARASGGNSGPTDGADGGSGGSSGHPTGDDVTDLQSGGGGGGGGGIGYIHIKTSSYQLGLISPDPS